MQRVPTARIHSLESYHEPCSSSANEPGEGTSQSVAEGRDIDNILKLPAEVYKLWVSDCLHCSKSTTANSNSPGWSQVPWSEIDDEGKSIEKTDGSQ